MPNHKSRQRINPILYGDWIKMWEDEKARGGSDGDVVMRFMSQARARRFSEVRHEIYGELQTIKASMEIFRLQLQNPALMESVIATDKAVDRIRTLLGNVSVS